jgi:hypothetical protein
MKQYVFLPIALVATLAMLLLSSCTISVKNTGEAIEAGEITKETRKLATFNKLLTSGAMDIEFISSDSTYIELEAGKNILPHIKTEVYNNTLKIQLDNAGGTPFISADKRTIHFQAKNGNNGGDSFKVKVFAPSLEEYKAAGAITLKSDSITSDNFIIKLAGACDADIKSLNSKNVKIKTAGSSNLDLKIINAENTELNTAGQSDAKITFDKCNRASITVAGASDITLKGTLNVLDKHLAGAMDLDTTDLKLKYKSTDNSIND